jgi:hypothetical protein
VNNADPIRFPTVVELRKRAFTFDHSEPVPNEPHIYVMYHPVRRAGRVGSAQGRNQFTRHGSANGWLEKQDANISRRSSSNFYYDAWQDGRAGFVYVILEQGWHLADRAFRKCREQEWMDALRDQTKLEDYSKEHPCRGESCPYGVAHPPPRPYHRRRPRP